MGTTLRIGAPMPRVTLVAQDGSRRSLPDPSGPNLLVFYRGDWWPYCNGQLVSFARKIESFRKAGVRLYAISIDSPEQNRAMIDKLLLPFDLLTDHEGEVAIKPFGFWDEAGRISKPALVLTDQSGIVRYLYVGRDFADRPKDATIMEALTRG